MEDLYDGGVGVYSEAKGEYTKQLIQFLTPALSRFFMKLLHQAQADVNTNGGRGLLAKFQELLSAVPEWNIDKVQRETAVILGETKCDYLEELLSAVFIAHTKVLTAIRPNSWKNKKVQIIVPKMDHFIHRTMSESCRLLWKSAYLFQQDLSAIDKQKNYRGVEMQIGEGVSNAIRGLLPVKNILKDCLAKTDDEDDSDSDSDSDDEKVKVTDVTPTHSQPIPIVQSELIPIIETNPIDMVNVESDIDISGNDRIFTHKATKEVNVEKLEQEQQEQEQEQEQEQQEQQQEEKEIPTIDSSLQTIHISDIESDIPSVKFNDYDQVYTPIVGGGGNTSLEYAPKNDEEPDENYEIDILGDSSSILSDVEDFEFSMEDSKAMGEGDYEIL